MCTALFEASWQTLAICHYARAMFMRFLARLAILTMAALSGWPLSALAQEPVPRAAPIAEVTSVPVEPVWQHGIAMHGDMKYPPDFDHFDYADPNAPKGGEIRLAVSSGFDSLNGFIIRGNAAPGVGLGYDTLLAASGDEAFTYYGLIAKWLRTPKDRSWVEFKIDPDAKFWDGTPVTAQDVAWTFETLREKGAPLYRYYYASVTDVKITAPDQVRFDFEPGENRELPLILGQLPVLPRHWWETRDFTSPILESPMGSGPYRVASMEPNRSITYERVPDYWAANKPTARGRYNFDRIRYDVYRDPNVEVEALKAGLFDYRAEYSAKNWAEAYNIPALEQGLLIKEEIRTESPQPMQGFIMNMRRWPFQDARVRQALAAGFDYEWSNRVLYYGQYEHARSYFNASELEAKGIPEGRELEILEPYRDDLPPELFTREYNPPSTAATGSPRQNLLDGLELLKQAGFEIDPKTLKLVDKETRRPFRFELLLVSPTMQRVAIPFVRNLNRMGIDVDIRLVDSSQYGERINNRDFDMFVAGWAQTLSPGNEQRDFFGSAAADRPGSRNFGGLKNAVVDALINLLIAAPTRDELVYRTRALDRVLQWQFLLVPQIYSPTDRVVYWNRFGHPKAQPIDGPDLFAWWVDPAKAAVTDGRRRDIVPPPGGS